MWVVRVFSGAESMIRLAGTVMAETDEDWPVRRCMVAMDAIEGMPPPEPGIDDEARLRAERLVLVAMEAAVVLPKES